MNSVVPSERVAAVRAFNRFYTNLIVVVSEGRPRGRHALRAVGPGGFGWVVQRHGALYAAEYGWDTTFEALVARLVADHIEDGRGEAWIAEVDGEPAGCVFCVPKSERVAQ